MYKNSFRFTGLYLLLCLPACTEKTPGYFPLETPYSWQYKAALNTMDTTKKQKYIIANMPKKSIEGQEQFIQRTLTGSEYVYAEDESGVYQLGYVRGDDPEHTFVPEKRVLFPYPLVTGTKWQDSVRTMALEKTGPHGAEIIENVPVQATLVAMDAKVKVAAGIFTNCLRIERTGEVFVPMGKYQYVQETVVSVKDTRWYAPGVGLVKSVRLESTQLRLLDHGEYQMELYAISKK
jgi:hypothetical protein